MHIKTIRNILYIIAVICFIAGIILMGNAGNLVVGTVFLVGSAACLAGAIINTIQAKKKE